MMSGLGTPVVSADTHATVESKPIWKSLTFWVNLVAGLAALLDWLTGQGFSFTATPEFGALVAFVNVILRFKSNVPATLTGGKLVDVPKRQS